jgi:hypothetical protein
MPVHSSTLNTEFTCFPALNTDMPRRKVSPEKVHKAMRKVTRAAAASRPPNYANSTAEPEIQPGSEVEIKRHAPDETSNSDEIAAELEALQKEKEQLERRRQCEVLHRQQDMLRQEV